MSSKNAYSPVTTLENAIGKTRNFNPEGSAKGIWRNLGKIVISRKGSTIQTRNCPHCQGRGLHNTCPACNLSHCEHILPFFEWGVLL